MEPRLSGLLALAIVGCGASPPIDRGDPADPIAELAWLAGRWVAEEDGTRTDEAWLPPAGGTMLGVGRSVEGGRTVHHEQLRIERRDEGIVYVASPSTQAETTFALVRSAPGFAVFEAPEHDFPQRITYARDGDRLEARVEDLAGERVARWHFRRVADAL